MTGFVVAWREGATYQIDLAITPRPIPSDRARVAEPVRNSGALPSVEALTTTPAPTGPPIVEFVLEIIALEAVILKVVVLEVVVF